MSWVGWTYEILRNAKVCLDGLVKETQVEPIHDVDEPDVDILESFGLSLQRPDKLRLGVEELLWKQGTTHRLKHLSPLGRIRAIMWRAQEDDAVGRNEDGAQVLRVGICDGRRVF